MSAVLAYVILNRLYTSRTESILGAEESGLGRKQQHNSFVRQSPPTARK
jgi:hypothetical protein